MKTLLLLAAATLTSTQAHASHGVHFPTGLDANEIRCEFTVTPRNRNEPPRSKLVTARLQGSKKEARIRVLIGDYALGVNTKIANESLPPFSSEDQLFTYVRGFDFEHEQNLGGTSFGVYPNSVDTEMANGDKVRVACEVR